MLLWTLHPPSLCFPGHDQPLLAGDSRQEAPFSSSCFRVPTSASFGQMLKSSQMLPLLQVRGRGGRALQTPWPPLLLPVLNLVLTLTVAFKCSLPLPLYQIGEMGPATLAQQFPERCLKGRQQGCK
ncbi:unnamed protein product [Rangifer tarandus platyrhynchus]|uniref:Uncharacterized protein n=1 Tax=Rangifer tarandus platyrhynchus TaxID=3082113 RepID=A0AC59Z2Y7_RANTA